MAPSRPEPPRSSSGKLRTHSDEVTDLEAQQAGRSATRLGAQHSVQAPRKDSRPVRHERGPWSSTPELLRPKSRPSLAQINDDKASLHSQDVSQATFALRDPKRSGSLSVLDSWKSKTAQGSGLPTNGHQDNRFLTVPVFGTARSDSNVRPQRPTLVIPGGLAAKSSHFHSPAGGTHLRSPRSVRDLGSDYTRYFTPLEYQAASTEDLTPQGSMTPLMTGAADAAISRRFSNPFADTKRLSNPFESPEDVNLPTSRADSACPIHEMHPSVVTLAPSLRNVAANADGSVDEEKPGFFQYMDDRLGAPGHSFPLMTDLKEDDDDMHMPQWDDDLKLKPSLKDHFTRENIVSTFGLIFMLLGLLCIFVVLPIVSYTGTSLLDYYYETPLDQMPGHQPHDSWTHVNDRKYPLLKNIRHGLIDPDTPESAMTRQSINGDTLVLAFSDEFNRKNRTFYHGDDPYWFGFEGWYGATQDLEWYDPDAINTGGGTLQLQLDQFTNHDLDFRSGMLNSWNQLCFKGGVFEVSMSLPGPAGKHGLWPGAWTMGNLGRPGYLATTDGLWPYTYNECDAGITNNQSMTDGTSILPGQRLSSCTCVGEDHPTPGTGRGAPEIDIAEVSADWSSFGIGVATQSFQVAPFDIWYYPNYDFMQTPNYGTSFVNSWTGGPIQQAVSTTSMLNNDWYDGVEYQKFTFEYSPGGDENAFVAWTIGDEETMRFDGRAIGPNGNVGQRLISEEPMSLILDLGISHSWVDVEFADLKFPAVLQIDYVRWYQREDAKMVTCDPPGYETTHYIATHLDAYHNPNFTQWEHAGYSWPKNSFVHECTT